MEPQTVEEVSAKLALTFSVDWPARLDAKLTERGVSSTDARKQVKISDSFGEIVRHFNCEDAEELNEDRFPLTVTYPVACRSSESAAARPSDLAEPGPGEEDEETHRGGRMTKRERKAARKKRGSSSRPPVGSPCVQGDTSPDLSSLSASPTPSPLLAQRKDSDPGDASAAAPDDGSLETDCWGELPPPAVPIEPPSSGCRENTSGGISSSCEHIQSEASSVQGQQAAEPPIISDARRLSFKTGGSINVQWTWREIQELLNVSGVSCGKPLVVNEGSSRFGSTYFYALPGLVFEVMQNDFVASLTICSVSMSEVPALFVTKPCVKTLIAGAAQ
jgi:hypothetical protein